MPLTFEATAGASFETIKPGPYNVTLARVEQKEQPKFGAPDETEVRLTWIFEVDPAKHPKTIRDDGSPHELRKWTSTASGPRSTARAIVQALLNRELATGEKLDIEDLYGKRCLAVVGYQKEPNGQIKKAEDGTPARNTIENFVPLDDDEDQDAPKRPVGAAAVKEAF